MDIQALESLVQEIVGRPVPIVVGDAAYTDGKHISIKDADRCWPQLPLPAKSAIERTITAHEASHIVLFDQEARKRNLGSLDAEDFYRLFADPLSPDQDSVPYVRLLANLVEDRLVDAHAGKFVGPETVENVNKFFVWNRQSGQRRSLAELESEGSPGRCAAFLEAIFQLHVYGRLVESFYSPELEAAAQAANQAVSEFGSAQISRTDALQRVLDALKQYCPPSWGLPSQYELPGCEQNAGSFAKPSEGGSGEGQPVDSNGAEAGLSGPPTASSESEQDASGEKGEEKEEGKEKEAGSAEDGAASLPEEKGKKGSAGEKEEETNLLLEKQEKEADPAGKDGQAGEKGEEAEPGAVEKSEEKGDLGEEKRQLQELLSALEEEQNEQDEERDEQGHRCEQREVGSGVYTEADLEVAFKKGREILARLADEFDFTAYLDGQAIWNVEKLTGTVVAKNYQNIAACKSDRPLEANLTVVVDLSPSCLRESQMFLAIAAGVIKEGVEIYLGSNGDAVPLPLPLPRRTFRKYANARNWIAAKTQEFLSGKGVSFDELMVGKTPRLVLILGDHDGVDQYTWAMQKYKTTRFIWLCNEKDEHADPPEGWSRRNYFPGLDTPSSLISILRRLK